jgi:signal transduction histidine kinase
MSSHHIGPLVGLFSVTLTVGFLTVYGGGRESKRADVAMAYGLLAWMVYMLWIGRFSDEPPDAVDMFIERIGLQVCLSAATLLVLIGAPLSSQRLWGLVGTPALGGVLSLWLWASTSLAVWLTVWRVFNLLFVGVLLVVLLRPLLRRPRAVAWGRFLLSAFLMLCALVAMWPVVAVPWLASAGAYTYPAALVCTWWMLSGRFGGRGAPFQHTAAAEDESGHEERQRIAQDVHDGVGAHLVSILSSLDARDPEQRALALSLEQCLLDIKIMVDGLYEDVTHPLEALAMLRYRVQPCLDRTGTLVVWDIEDSPAMGQLSPHAVTQFLKIAQEAIANVMRHAQATEIRVVCEYDEAGRRIELTIADNGRGFDDHRRRHTARSKGLAGMQRRAMKMGGTLEIESAPGQGTRVHLTLPCPDPAFRLGSEEAAQAPSSDASSHPGP